LNAHEEVLKKKHKDRDGLIRTFLKLKRNEQIISAFCRKPNPPNLPPLWT
jgi:hypothetical protein